MTCGTYIITNRINKKWYAGQSVNIEVRWKGYRKGTAGNPYLKNALVKYGLNNFDFKVICVCAREELDFYEQQLLDMCPDYNMSKTASSTKGIPCPKNVKLAVALSNSARVWTEEARNKVSALFKGRIAPNKGKSPSMETRNKISKANKGNTSAKGNTWSEERKKNFSKLMLGNKSAKGIKLSKEHIQSIREGHKKYWDKKRQEKENCNGK